MRWLPVNQLRHSSVFSCIKKLKKSTEIARHISHSWLIILKSFLLVGGVGGVGGHAQPTHLVEDTSGGEADTPTKFQPNPSNDYAVHALHTDRQTDSDTNNGIYIIDIYWANPLFRYSK